MQTTVSYMYTQMTFVHVEIETSKHDPRKRKERSRHTTLVTQGAHTHTTYRSCRHTPTSHQVVNASYQAQHHTHCQPVLLALQNTLGVHRNVTGTPWRENTHEEGTMHLAHDQSLKGPCCKARSVACSQGTVAPNIPGWSKPAETQACCWYTRQHAHVCAASWPNLLWASPGLPNDPRSLTSTA
jgi:hypothetical protein